MGMFLLSERLLQDCYCLRDYLREYRAVDQALRSDFCIQIFQDRIQKCMLNVELKQEIFLFCLLYV